MSFGGFSFLLKFLIFRIFLESSSILFQKHKKKNFLFSFFMVPWQAQMCQFLFVRYELYNISCPELCNQFEFQSHIISLFHCVEQIGIYTHANICMTKSIRLHSSRQGHCSNPITSICVLLSELICYICLWLVISPLSTHHRLQPDYCYANQLLLYHGKRFQLLIVR